jgi:hypothetical protein
MTGWEPQGNLQVMLTHCKQLVIISPEVAMLKKYN